MNKKVVAELNHQINSPLAAIRNALYLIGCRSQDAEIQRYLALAEGEVVQIAGILQIARAQTELQDCGGLLVRKKAA